MDIGSERGGDERCSRCEDGRLSRRPGNEPPYHRICGARKPTWRASVGLDRAWEGDG